MRGGNTEQRRWRRALDVRGATLGKEVEHVLALLAGGVRDRHDALGEPLAALTLASERALAPKNEGPELSLCVIICRFDAVVRHERPQRALVREDVRARAREPRP